MVKGKTCNTSRKLNESINELGRWGPCQATKEKHILKDWDAKRRKQERLDNPKKFREREKKYIEANSEKIKASRKE